MHQSGIDAGYLGRDGGKKIFWGPFPFPFEKQWFVTVFKQDHSEAQ